MVTYEIRQAVRTVRKYWHIVVYSSEIERVARMSYDEFIKNNPEEYFELIRVEHTESCLEFTVRQTPPEQIARIARMVEKVEI